MTTNPPRLAVVVSHTHWDREWYLSFSRFRTKLVAVVRQVLDALEDEEGFAHFLMDGQAIVLEDYLAIRPEDEARIRRLVEAGRLSIGPWYVLPDEFLISAEAHVRNLIIGHQVCRRLGGAQKVGYMPDSFGHIAQIPQILRRARIDAFVYTRGTGDEIERLGWEYRWCAPDGSAVTAINQCEGYCNAGSLGLDEGWQANTIREVRPATAVKQVRTLFDKMAPRANGDVYLINNGCDHLPPQAGLAAILAALADAFPDTTFRHGSLTDYLDAVREARIAVREHAGELLGGKDQFALPGVWSARMYLKQWNDRAQSLLSAYAEPISAYARFIGDQAYQAGLIGYHWKLLLQNHPHDSICGCSIDDVHRDMIPRFRAVVDTAEQLVADHLVGLAPTFATTADRDGETALCVMNPLPVDRTAVIERLVVLQPPGVDPDALEVVDQDGRPVESALLDAQFVERFWGVDYRTILFGERGVALFQSYRDRFPERIVRDASRRDESDQFVTLQFIATVPALAHRVYRVRMRPGPAPLSRAPLATAGHVLENAWLRVTVRANGMLDLVHKPTGRVYRGLNRLVDVADAGDEYDFAPADVPRDVTNDEVRGDVRVLDDTGLRARVEVRFALDLPECVTADRRGRARRSVSCPACMIVTVDRDRALVDIDLRFDNRARDHRLRAEFPTDLRTDALISDGHFYINARPIDIPNRPAWVQPPSGTYPQQDFSLLHADGSGLAVLNRGLPEVAPMRLPGGAAGIALTLLRAVGWLSRDDFDTRRRRNAGPTIATPDAQCLGEQRFRYAIVPFGDEAAARIKAAASEWRTQMASVQGVEDGHVAGGAGLLRVSDPAVAVTAVKRHETRDTLIVRLCNLTAAGVEPLVECGRAVRAAWMTDELEERVSALPVAVAGVRPPVGPYEIATIELDFAGQVAGSEG